jgi:hypothetical protein
MAIREMRIEPDALLLIFQAARGEPSLPRESRVTDVALDHHGQGDHRGRPPTIVLQIESGDFDPSDAGRPLLPMSFTR